MPRLVHQPPKYARHRSTKQAVVYYRGKRQFLGPYGSAQSHHAYRKFLHSWNRDREQERITATGDSETSTAVAKSIAEVSLREKRMQGEPVTVTELILVYRRRRTATALPLPRNGTGAKLDDLFNDQAIRAR